MNSVKEIIDSSREVLNERCVVVCSGGQDSITCLYWALKKFKSVLAINFYYGQRHAIEVELAEKICNDNGVIFMSIDISPMMVVTSSALLNKVADINGINLKGLPASFVPNRNQMFLTMAHSFAQLMNSKHLVTGVCQTDFSGYFDCRDIFIRQLERVLNLGSNGHTLTAEWIAGFIEGEGCFSRGSQKNNDSTVYYPTFSLEQTDLGILQELKQFFGVGSIRERTHTSPLSKKRSWEYKVSRYDCSYIKNLMEKSTCYSGRNRDKFDAWCEEHSQFFERNRSQYMVFPENEALIKIHTPIMFIDKADTFKLAEELGCLDTVVNDTMTCYNGDTSKNDWGMGCGNCPACKLRKNGYEEY